MKRILLILVATLFLTTNVYAISTVVIAPKTYKVLTTVVSVTTAATALPTTAMAGRKYIRAQNIGTATIYIGDANVTADTASTGGVQLLPYATWEEMFDDTVVIYGIVATGTQNIVVEEGK